MAAPASIGTSIALMIMAVTASQYFSKKMRMVRR